MESLHRAQAVQKKAYTAPKLVIHGPVEEITQGCDKRFGTTDGFTFQGLAIQCAS